MNEWINVKDEPVEKGAVLVFNAEYGEGRIHKAYCLGPDHVVDSGIYSNRLYKVTHWFPISPPEKEQ